MNNNIRRRNTRLDKLAAWRCWLAGLLFWLSFNTAVLGEETAPQEAVLTRARPELTPIGAKVGGFRFYPTLAYKGLYDDNIFATQNDKQSSLISEYSLETSLRSNWPNHQLNLLAGTDIRRHSDFSSEDHENWKISTDGKLDISRDSQLYAGGDIKLDHVDRTSPDDADGVVPTQFKETNVFGRYTFQLQRFHIGLNTNLTKKDYDDVPGIVNGVNVTINQDDRDRTEHAVGLRVGYEVLSSQDQIFIVLTGNRREYDELQALLNADRSSEGYEALIGLALDSGGVTFGNLSAGYHVQDYKDPFPDIRAPAFDASLNWNATTLTSVSVDIHRSIIEATGIFFSGYISTNSLVTVDHELRRNLLMKLAFKYTTDDYESIGPAERSDSTHDALVGATYMINRYIHVSMEYHNIQRQSTNNIPTSNNSNEFEKNIVFIQLQGQL